MKFTVATPILQEMVSKAVKGASNDNQRPLTSLIAIQLKDNILTMITSSETNYLYVSRPNITGDDFYVVTPVEKFAKLVSKLTAENTTLSIENDNIVVTSGGKYTVDVSINAEGEFTKYPDPYNTKIDFEELQDIKSYPVKKSTLGLILAVNSASLAGGEIAKDIPTVYTGYHISKSIVTTDTIKMCGVGINISGDDVLIVRDTTMKLTELFTAENLEFVVYDNTLIIRPTDSVDCVIVSKLMDDEDEFQIDAINGLLADTYESSCSVSKTKLLQILDRLSLFIDKLDDFAVYLTFSKDGIMLSNKKSSSEELIAYEASDNFKAFSCKANIMMLTEQIKAAPGDLINIEYGSETCLKFTDGNVTQLIALIE